MSTTYEGPRTDATLLRRGTTVLHPSGRARRWDYLSGLQKAKWLVGGVGTVGWAAYGWIGDDSSTLTTLAAGCAYTVAVGVRESVRVVTENKARERERVIAKAMTTRLGGAQGATAKEWVTYAPGRRGHGATVTVKLPGDYGRNLRQAEKDAELVARRAGFKKGHDFDLTEHLDPPVMVVREMEVPPDEVLFADVQDHLNQARSGSYFLGIGVRNKPWFIDLHQDAPHLVWSCGSGAGKSTAVRSVAAQARRAGDRVIILDYFKRGGSHRDWALYPDGSPIPGIELITTVQAAFQRLVELAQEMEDRYDAEARGETFNRVLVVFEEQNASYDVLNDYFINEIREKATEKNPAMRATKGVVYAGRQILVNAFVACQRFDANIMGGGAVRGNFGVRILSRHDEQARRMLIPDVLPKPIASSHLGRSIICIGDKSHPVQGVFMTPAEAREWATTSPDEATYGFTVSEVSEVVVGDQPVPAAQGHTGVDGDNVGQLGHRHLSVVPGPEVDTATISEAVDQGLVTGSKAAVQRASNRPGFPTPKVKGGPGRPNRYAKADLMLWEAGRTGAVEIDDEADIDIDGGR